MHHCLHHHASVVKSRHLQIPATQICHAISHPASPSAKPCFIREFQAHAASCSTNSSYAIFHVRIYIYIYNTVYVSLFGLAFCCWGTCLCVCVCVCARVFVRVARVFACFLLLEPPGAVSRGGEEVLLSAVEAGKGRSLTCWLDVSTAAGHDNNITATQSRNSKQKITRSFRFPTWSHRQHLRQAASVSAQTTRQLMKDS